MAQKIIFVIEICKRNGFKLNRHIKKKQLEPCQTRVKTVRNGIAVAL